MKFSVVPECIPDVVPPTISLVTPQNTKQILPLDAKFVFAIRDIGKGVNKDTVKITLNGERYTADSAYMTWDNEYLTFYPKNWLPVDSDIYLTITASDVQEYGGSNILKKEFVFRTSQ